MNRRQVFAVLAAAAAVPNELWIPKRTIFLPPKGGWPAKYSYWLEFKRPIVPSHVFGGISAFEISIGTCDGVPYECLLIAPRITVNTNDRTYSQVGGVLREK